MGENQLLQNPLEGFKAKSLLKKQFQNLNPLQKVGTRVIITRPKKELWNGFFPTLGSPIAKYIEETWWELLRDDKEVFLKWRGEKIKVNCPIYYTNKFIKKECREEWWVNDASLNWKKNSKVKVKELEIIYSKKKIPKEFRGIAIQRAGMKICNFDVKIGNPLISSELAENIYGWITFNKEAEKELREIEDPTHYDYRASIGTFGFHLFGRNGWLAQEISKFGDQKLGLGKEEKKFERLDIIVANKLNRFFKKYYPGVPLNITTPPPGVKEPISRQPKEIRIKMLKPTFPSEDTRKVKFGESISNIGFLIINDTNLPRKIKTSLVLKTATKTVMDRILRNFVSSKTVLINSNSESGIFGPYSIIFEKDKFDSGTYAIEAEIVLLEGDVLDDRYGKGVIVDQERELIYLDVDPPTGRGLFEFIDRVEFKKDKELQYRVKEKEDKMRIEINIIHPAYKHIENLDDFLEKTILYEYYKGNRPLLDYELSIGAEVIAQYDIQRDAMFVRDNKDKFIIQRAEDKNAFFIEAIDQATRIAQRIRYEVL